MHMTTADGSGTPAGVRGPCAWLHFGSALRTRRMSRSSGMERSLGDAASRPPAPWPTVGRSLGSVPRPSMRSGSFMLGRRPRPSQQQQQQQRRRRRASSLSASLAYQVDDEQTSLGDEARQALAQGDVYGALLLLEERQIGVVGTEGGAGVGDGKSAAGAGAGAVEGGATAAEAAEGTTARMTNASPPGQDQGQGKGRENATPPPPPAPGAASQVVASPRAAHAKLVQLLWRSGHEQEALEAFDLARTRARKAIFAQQHQQHQPVSPDGGARRRAPPAKYGAGIPGLFLDLDPDTCHGIMRRKLENQDWLGVIEAMRAASRVRPRAARGRSGSLVQKEEGLEGGVGGGTAAVAAGDGAAGKQGWAPTEETYALALEACGKVSCCW